MLQAVLSVAAVVGVFVSIWAQQHLPPAKPTIVGIDLGTTYSVVAAYHTGAKGRAGRVEVMPDTDGRTSIPSVVAFTEHGAVVGPAAKGQAEANPRNTIYDAKRFIGKRYDDKIQSEAQRYQFEVVEKENSPWFAVQSEGQRREVSPEEVGSLIIGTLKKTAEKHLKLDKPLKMAVMSVPADFGEEQRNATIAAAALAGLDVLRVISEPTAAAMAYGLHDQERRAGGKWEGGTWVDDVDKEEAVDPHAIPSSDYKQGFGLIMVFDFGGGTLDVSLLGLDYGVFVTMAIAGNSRLGGEDFTHAVAETLMAEYGVQHGAESVESLSADAKQAFRLAAERVKLQLSAESSVQVEVDLTGTAAKTNRLTMEYTRAMFEADNKHLFDKMLDPVTAVLTASKVPAAAVGEVVLVGGSTRIPKVRALLTEYFGKPPNSAINPDEAVAVGVAVQAGILTGAWPLSVAATELPTADLRKIEVGDETSVNSIAEVKNRKIS